MKYFVGIAAVLGLVVWMSMRSEKPSPAGADAGPQSEASAPVADEPMKPVAKPVFNPNRWNEVLGDSEASRFLAEGFRLANAVDEDPAQAEAHAAWLMKLRSNPLRFRQIVEWGLKQIPRSPEFAYERAGLLSFLEEDQIPAEVAEKLAREELLYVSASQRPSAEESRSDEEFAEAMSTDPEQLRNEVAFDVWLKRIPMTPESVQEFVPIFEATSRPDLKKKFIRLFLERDPSREGDLRTQLTQRGVEPDEWIPNDRSEN